MNQSTKSIYSVAKDIAHRKFLVLILFGLGLFSCKKDNHQTSELNESDQYAICNSALPNCANGIGNYCLFGYKWGPDTAFLETGINAIGPKVTGGTISYSFQEENGLINTHKQINLTSRSFDHILSCAKDEIRNALNSWAAIADIKFEELPENSPGDIRFFIADIIQSGIGYPNYPDAPCTAIKGTMIIQTSLSIQDCADFYTFALHEIGHVLGLGHVSTENIMHADYDEFDFDSLQAGDKQGIIEIYGEK